MRACLAIIVLSGLIFTAIAIGQATPSQPSVTSQSTTSSPSSEVGQPAESSSEAGLDPASLLSDLPPLSPAKATLVGGFIEKLDRVRDQLTVQVFGGGRMKILFDTRSRVYRDGAAASAADLKPGDRVYVDTTLEGSNVFARSIRLRTATPEGEIQGVILSYHPDKAEILIRDSLSPEPLRLQLTSSTRLSKHDRLTSVSELSAGTLITAKFDPQPDGRGVAREVSILAFPGTSFVFSGQVTTLDLRTGLLVLTSATDRKTYEIYLDPSVAYVDHDLRQGADVEVLTRFDGTRYLAQRVTINRR